MKRELYYGDNLEILQNIEKESIDLIYLDPPFNSNAKYNILFKNKDGKESPAQFNVFEDTWSWNIESELILEELLKSTIADVILGLEKAIGRNDMLAYLVMMAIRLLGLYKILKPTGSLYLHCDPTASHYLKIILDAIFEPKFFKNEIIWKRVTSSQKGSQHKPKKFGNNHDIILFYGKTENAFFNPPKKKMGEKELEDKFPNIDEDGKRWKDDSAHIWSTPGMEARPNLCYTWKGFKNPHPSGWRLSKSRMNEEYKKGNFEIVTKKDGSRKLIRKVYQEDYQGENIGDLWDDINPAQGKERVGYPTQKPQALLERIIKSSSKKDDIILDPFCGCGTSIMAAEKLKRNWIGIDITYLAVDLVTKRLDTKPKITGVPKSLDDAQKLADSNKLQFQMWAVSLLGLLPNKKQASDRGVDGWAYFKTGKKYEKIIASVKGGNRLNPGMIRDLVGTMKSERSALGIFFCLKEPSKGMKEAAASSGIYTTPVGEKYPRVQIYNIQNYFKGIKLNIPNIITTNIPKQKIVKGEQSTLDVDDHT